MSCRGRGTTPCCRNDLCGPPDPQRSLQKEKRGTASICLPFSQRRCSRLLERSASAPSRPGLLRPFSKLGNLELPSESGRARLQLSRALSRALATRSVGYIFYEGLSLHFS